MKIPVMLSLRGRQTYQDQEPDVIELVTEGTLEYANGGWNICYEETELTGLQGVITLFRVEPDKILLTRTGKLNSQMVFEKDVCFSIVVPLYNTPIPFLKEMISSVVAQTYPKWELCLADGSDGSHEDVEKEVLHLAAKEPRIKYRKLEENRGISENTNECLKMSTGNYIALFDHDDILHPSALFEMMKAICEKDADYVYTDEVTFESPNIKKLLSYHFKPDFAIDNLRANNYICHFSAFSRELLDKAGYFRSEYDGSQDHDMILRLTSYAKNVIHIPKILYFWRSHPTSVAMDINSKPYAIEAGKRAVCDHIKSSGYEAEVESSRAFPTIYRIRYKLKAQTPEKVSIIIPNKNNARLIRRCIQSILDRTSYKNYEIVIVDSHSTQKGTLDFYDTLNQFDNVKVVNYDKEFNYSVILNFGAQFATGEYLVFLHSDVQIISRRWIEELLMYVQRDDVGIAGGMLYYPDETIQHAGIVLGLGDDRIAGHIFHGQSKEIIGYMGRACYSQNLSAVTSACMMVKTSVFVNIGGFNEEYPNKFSDVDFCLKVRQCGKLIVWTPYAEAIHLESRTREKKHIDDQDKLGYTQECEKFKAQWKDVLSAGDPYYNPNFSLDSPNFDVRVWSI